MVEIIINQPFAVVGDAHSVRRAIKGILVSAYGLFFVSLIPKIIAQVNVTVGLDAADRFVKALVPLWIILRTLCDGMHGFEVVPGKFTEFRRRLFESRTKICRFP